MTTTVPDPRQRRARPRRRRRSDLLAERYDEALADYRAALAADSDDEALGHKLRRAEEAAASAAADRGEQQTRVFAEPVCPQVASGDVLVPAPDLPAPGASVQARRGPPGTRRGSSSAGASAPAGPRSSTASPSWPAVAARAARPGRTGTRSASGSRGRCGSGTRSSSSPTCARRSSPTTWSAPTPRGEDRLRRRGPRAARLGAALAHRRRVLEQPPQGRRRPLRPDGRRRVHPVLPQRRRRPRAGRGPAARGPGDRPGERARAEPAPAGRTGERRPSRSSTSGRRPGSSSRTPTGSATAPTTRAPHRPDPARRRRPAAGATASTTSTCARPTRPDPPARGRRAAPDVPQRGHPLVGRLADLRQRLGDPAPGALHGGRQAHHRRRRDPPGRPRDRHRAHRLLAQLVGRARAAPHGVRPRAQRDLRHAGRAPPRLGRRGAVPDGPAGQRRGDGQDPHHRVDAGDPAQPRAQRRHDEQLVRPGHQRPSAAGASRCSRRSRSPAASSAASSATRRAPSRSTG